MRRHLAWMVGWVLGVGLVLMTFLFAKRFGGIKLGLASALSAIGPALGWIVHFAIGMVLALIYAAALASMKKRPVASALFESSRSRHLMAARRPRKMCSAS